MCSATFDRTWAPLDQHLDKFGQLDVFSVKFGPSRPLWTRSGPCFRPRTIVKLHVALYILKSFERTASTQYQALPKWARTNKHENTCKSAPEHRLLQTLRDMGSQAVDLDGNRSHRHGVTRRSSLCASKASSAPDLNKNEHLSLCRNDAGLFCVATLLPDVRNIGRS